MKKVLFVTTFFWLSNLFISLIVLQSCVGDDCSGRASGSITDIESSILRITGSDFFQGNRTELLNFETVSNIAGFQVPYDSLAIRMRFGVNSFSKTHYYPGGHAYACSPSFPAFLPNEIIVTSTSDYDDEHPAGSNLVDFFEYGLGILRPLGQNQNLSELEFIKGEDHFFLILKSPPKVMSSHSFKFQFRTSEGAVLIEELFTITVMS